jgi:hypothetical protein
MSNRDLPPNERLRALHRLYRLFCEDQDGYARYYARAQAEAEHHARKRAERAVGNGEVE